MGVFGLISSLPLLMLFLVLSSLGGGLVGNRVCFDMESDTFRKQWTMYQNLSMTKIYSTFGVSAHEYCNDMLQQSTSHAKITVSGDLNLPPCLLSIVFLFF